MKTAKSPIPSEMKSNPRVVFSYSTLTITSTEPLDAAKHGFLVALGNVLDKVSTPVLEPKSNLCLRLDTSTYLVANFSPDANPRLIVFESNAGKPLFDVDLSVFNKRMEDFSSLMLSFSRSHPELDEQSLVTKTSKAYAEDIVDFYSNSRLLPQKVVKIAREIYDDSLNI